MVPKVEKPAAVLDASSTESTSPEVSVATDAKQVDAVAPTNNLIEPDSSEKAVSTGTEGLNMEATLAPNAAQEQGKELEPITEAEYLPATDDEVSRHPVVTKSEKKAASASRRDRKKKDGAKMSRERVENMAANEACREGQSRAIRYDLARLSSMRLALCAKVNTGTYLDESLVKRVTGYDQ